jgi:hypothetical protein
MTAIISQVRCAPTHDGEAAFVIELRFPNGGRSTVQINGEEAADVMKSAGVREVEELVGHPWTVLDIRTPCFTGWT